MALFNLPPGGSIQREQLEAEILAATGLTVTVWSRPDGLDVADDQGGTEHAAAIQAVIDAHVPEPPTIRQISKREWMHRLPRATQRAIRKSPDDDVQDGVEEMRMANIIDLDDPLIPFYVDLLLSKGLITAAQKAALLAPKVVG